MKNNTIDANVTNKPDNLSKESHEFLEHMNRQHKKKLQQ